MATERFDPYGNFNYQVDLGGGTLTGARAGFQEVTGLNVEVTKAEYRAGNDPKNHVRKYSSVYKVGDITLKRGMMGATDLYQWIDKARTGDPAAKVSVSIMLRDESGQNTVMTWRLASAWPLKYTAPPFNAKTGTDVAIEELVITCEDVTVE